MAVRRFALWFALTLATIAGTVEHRVAGAQQGELAARRFALLVGVTEYPNLDKQLWLQGPVNDVRLMADVLQRAPFSIPAADVVTLSEDPSDRSRRPTRANIEREFKRLEGIARKNDQIAILMAGHGSQQPADDDPADEEPDGMDEIFLPADVGTWNGGTGRVVNAIVDDDIRAWVTAIRNKGAFVWLIFDSCQSGTMARGTNTERDRRVLPSVLRIPDSALRSAESRTRGAQRETQLLGLPSTAGGIAAMYASEMRETTPEKRLPNVNSPWHGLFTYTIARVLQESRSPLTYRELAERVIGQYRSEGRYGPNPMFEGGGIDREILEQRTWPDRPEMMLGGREDRGGWTLRAGTIQTATVGTILEIFPPAGAAQADVPVGYVRVTSAEATTAVVEPVAFGDRPSAPERLVIGSRGRIAAYEFGVDQLRLGVQVPRRVADGENRYDVVAQGLGPAILENAVANLPMATSGLARREPTESEADWVVRVVNGDVALVPASGWNPSSASETAGPPPIFRVTSEDDPLLGQALQNRLRRIVRARNLLKLATAPGASAPNIDFSLEMIRYENDRAAAVPMTSGGRTLQAGDDVAFSLRNRGASAIDVTLFLVDDGYGITLLFPPTESATAGRLDVGQSRTTDRFRVTADRVELDQVVAIAVRASTPPINFSALAQPTLEQVRSAAVTPPGGTEPRGPGFLLHELLTNTMFGGTMTRSLTPRQVSEHAMRLLAWRSVPREP